ncbi:unnamed protein product [Pedinophyceae sp. YPF-701]|nr:unnamed protein product [Pedinophyceae sp. YPF-701]
MPGAAHRTTSARRQGRGGLFACFTGKRKDEPDGLAMYLGEMARVRQEGAAARDADTGREVGQSAVSPARGVPGDALLSCPAEVLNDILARLDGRAKANARACSKHARDAVDEKAVTAVSWPSTRPLEAAHLALLARLPQLESVAIEHAPVTPDCVRAVAAGANIKRVVLGHGRGRIDRGLGSAALRPLARLPALEELAIAGLTELDLGVFAGLNLRKLRVNHTRTIRGFDTLATMTNLTEVDLSLTGAWDMDMKALSRCVGLRVLKAAGCPVTDAGVAHLANCPAGLTSLTLDRCEHFAGEALKGLAATLVTLSLRDCPSLTQEALRHVSAAPHLATLRLDHCPQIADTAIFHLSGHPKLRTLSLKSTSITDAGVAALRELPSLSDLDLDSCQVTNDGVLALLPLAGQLRRLSAPNTRASLVDLKDLQRVSGATEAAGAAPGTVSTRTTQELTRREVQGAGEVLVGPVGVPVH